MDHTNRKYYLVSLVGIFLLSFLSLDSYAQKVALVLSGGGAKGLAHLGVMKALEDNNIPIDYIVGTSMGGVVGGFYAGGYSIEEMEGIVYSEAFQNWVSGKSTEKYDYYLYKDAPDASTLSLKVNLDSSFHLSLTPAIVKDYALNFALEELLARPSIYSEQSFDSLLVPFRCLASDIFTQQEVVLRKGKISEAIRATLNVPLFFKPIKVNNKYLYDGGIYNNFPVDVAQKEFDADVIIGVNVSNKTYNRYPYEEDEDLVANANPLIYMWISKSDSSQLDSASVYIQPKLEAYSVLDFGAVRNIVEEGYQEALAKMPEIKAKIKQRQSQQNIQQKRLCFNEELPPLEVQGVSVQGLKPSPHKYVSRILNHTDRPLGLEKVKQQFFRLAETDKFERLYPSFIYNKEEETFDFELKAKTDRSIIGKIGGNLSSRNISQLYLGLGYDFVGKYLYSTRINLYTGRFYFSTEAKARVHIPSLIPLYIEPRVTYNRWNYTDMRAIFSNRANRNETILTQRDIKFGVDLGLAISRKGKIVSHAGYFLNRYHYANEPNISLQDTLDVTQFRGSVFQIAYTQNNLNRRLFPSEGQALMASVQYLNGRERLEPGSNSIHEEIRSKQHQWLRLKISFEKYHNFGKYSLGYLLEGVGSNEVLFQNYTSTLAIAPTFNPLIDSRSLFLTNFRAFNYTALGLKQVIKLKPHLEIRAETYAFAAYTPIREGQFQSPENNLHSLKMRWAGTLGGVYHSMLGPISLHLNYYDEPRNRWGVILNIGIIMYNKKALE